MIADVRPGVVMRERETIRRGQDSEVSNLAVRIRHAFIYTGTLLLSTLYTKLLRMHYTLNVIRTQMSPVFQPVHLI